MQVWRNGSVNGAQEFRLVSYKCGHFVIPLKRQPQNALAAVAGCAKKEDFHNRRSSAIFCAVCCAIGFSPLVFQSRIVPLPTRNSGWYAQTIDWAVRTSLLVAWWGLFLPRPKSEVRPERYRD